jgi:glucose-1-phosphate thymidylyltransferase
MKCIILCAGHVLNDTPKALRVVNNVVALTSLVNKINKIKEIDDIFVVTNGENYDTFEKWKEETNAKVKIINDNTTSPEANLGAIGDIKFTINCENLNDDLFIVAGDAIYDFDFTDFINYYHEKKTSIVAVKHVDTPLELKKYGVIKFDENNLVTQMKEKVNEPIGNYMALALYIYPKNIIRLFDFYLSEGNRRTFPGYFLEYLYQDNDVYAYEINGDFISLK